MPEIIYLASQPDPAAQKPPNRLVWGIFAGLPWFLRYPLTFVLACVSALSISLGMVIVVLVAKALMA